MRRWLLISFLGVIAVILLLIGGGLWWLVTADLKPWVEKLASDALERKVTAETFEIGWGDPIQLTIGDLKVANAPWGSEPDMISLRSLDAEIEPASLWDGMPVYRQLRAVGLKVVLERDKSGAGNWKFGGGGGSGTGGFAIIPKNRTQFPTLLDMGMTEALITYRTRSGNLLSIKLDQVTITAPSDTQPVDLVAKGAYNDTPLTLTAKTESFRALRDKTHPFATDLTIAGRTARIDFTGTMMEPLDVEGVAGKLTLDAPELDNLLASFGAEVEAKYPLVLAGDLTRQGDHWELTGGEGAIAGMPFTGNLILDEGRNGAPDDVAADLAFDELKIDAFLGDSSSAGAGDWRQMALAAPEDAGANLDAKLTARRLSYGDIKLADFSGKGHSADGEVVLEKVDFGIAGGVMSAEGGLVSEGDTSRLDMATDARGIDADRLAQEIGASAGEITGKIDGLAVITARGATMGEAATAAEGEMLVGIIGGSIRASVIEMASTDLRALFREEKGNAALRCLGLRVTLQDGEAFLRPLQLQAEGATLDGNGRINLKSGEINLRLESQRESSGFFALDLPIEIGGTFDDISAGLAEKGAGPGTLPPPNPKRLTPEMRQLIAGNPCLQ
ncbi:AsmA-like C-terminal region-containing protein [Dongia sp.]|uniref:AsmA family protein n=1 Tax=Dongia sp. TaxID=1977262 RepID=UPI0035B1E8DE